jgi:transposase, IS5 family
MFCRIGLDTAVPHPTTLMKLTTRCGSAAVDGLNEALVTAKAVEAKLQRTARIRADTTWFRPMSPTPPIRGY